MSSHPSPPDHAHLRSGATATSNRLSDFVETLEHRRFVEFCEACRRYRYIGLCYGPPGVGKTLSARRFSRVEQVEQIEKHDLWSHEPIYGLAINTLYYTPPVVNTPAQIGSEIDRIRTTLTELARGPIRRQAEIILDTLRVRNENYRRAHPGEAGRGNFYDEPPIEPTYSQVAKEFETKKRAIGDPTTLILIDEADRLRMSGLEQVRSIFDKGRFGLVLIGMPGIEKRMARYPQLYSRIGFVHEFRPLGLAEMRFLLERRWAPVGVKLPEQAPSEEAAAAVLRITGGNFRLFHRLLTQIERVLEINGLHQVTKEVVEAARESLVIGQA
jgi:DNA transposition AAA+ family ATPase